MLHARNDFVCQVQIRDFHYYQQFKQQFMFLLEIPTSEICNEICHKLGVIIHIMNFITMLIVIEWQYDTFTNLI